MLVWMGEMEKILTQPKESYVLKYLQQLRSTWVESVDSLDYSGEVSFSAMDALDVANEQTRQEDHKEEDQYDQ